MPAKCASQMTLGSPVARNSSARKGKGRSQLHASIPVILTPFSVRKSVLSPIHPCALDQILLRSPRGVGSSVNEHDIKRLYLVPDAIELILYVLWCDPLAIGLMTEIQQHAFVETPFQRDVVYSESSSSAIHDGMIVVRSIQMGPAVRGEREKLESPPPTLLGAAPSADRGRNRSFAPRPQCDRCTESWES